MRTVALHTLGCKLNYAETSMIGKQFLDRGYRIVASGEPADVTVLNTCSVTGNAERECRQLIRRARRASAETVVVVTGCYAQLQPEEIASIDGVNLVLGTSQKFRLLEHLHETLPSSGPRIVVSPVDAIDDFGPAFSTDASDRTRAFLKVQDGCDYSCSFCTIPLARGGSRSQSIEACVSQAAALTANGYREIVLTGVNVGDYGKKSGESLLMLLRALVDVPGLERLRISSIEPNLLTDELIRFIASHEQMCRHLHIPLQSGHDEVLRMMRRRYSTVLYRDLISRIKDCMPECGIGVDVIVGFPGETDAHFEETRRFLADLPVSYLHVFTYSERPDTPAAGLGSPVPHAVRSRRNSVLRELSARKRRAFIATLAGQTVPVLFEAQVEQGIRFGLTGTYVKVGVPVGQAGENALVEVEILECGDEVCTGSVVSRGAA